MNGWIEWGGGGGGGGGMREGGREGGRGALYVQRHNFSVDHFQYYQWLCEPMNQNWHWNSSGRERCTRYGYVNEV